MDQSPWTYTENSNTRQKMKELSELDAWLVL